MHKLHLPAGLYGLEVDIEQLTEAKDQHEQQLEKEAEALRGLKAQNEQVWSGHCSNQ
jgi:predicted ATP-grasp superfamily ATP-dependent carboligase